MNQNIFTTKTGPERAVLVAAITKETPEYKVNEYLEELALLTETAGGLPMKTFTQKMGRMNAATYIGPGKLKEIAEYVAAEKIELVVFDDDLTPSQVTNINEALTVKVLDRSGIILHIFGVRARSAQAKAQVELAQLQYLLPRLAGLWTHHSRQKGGIGMKGSGEKEIETDRRQIRKKIEILKDELEKIEKQTATRRRGREEKVRVSLVGYTNAGKSTLMNALSKADVLAENKLFATLDTTVRKMALEGIPFLLSDTVGFIRKLPHGLVECFNSTLDEVKESDILLHVIDISHPSFEEQIKVVNDTLVEIGVSDKPIIFVFNKIDMLPEEQRQEIQTSWLGKVNAPAVFISAEKRENMDLLRSAIVEKIKLMYKERFPFAGQPGNPIFYPGYEITPED